MRMGNEKGREILIKYKNFILETTGKDLQLQGCGFLISLQNSWLGASPDAVVVEKSNLQSCIEVKLSNAVAHWGETISEAARNNKSFCLKFNDCGSLALKRSHNYLLPSMSAAIICRNSGVTDVGWS